MAATATAPAPAAKTKSERYEFVEDVWVDELGSSNRVLVEKGTAFTAEMVEEFSRERVLPSGRTVPPESLGQMYVAKSDIPVEPGCLTSCIRTGRAKTPAQIRIDAEREAEAKKRAKK